jgi:hypothetical protein
MNGEKYFYALVGSIAPLPAWGEGVDEEDISSNGLSENGSI